MFYDSQDHRAIWTVVIDASTQWISPSWGLYAGCIH